jgi:DNA helicase-2/ATP-dependent DNA helicase PcrA
MSAVNLELADLALLARLTPDLDFTDAERQEALLENQSRDFNAVPGSGKTSLLAAKLLLLAQKWPHAAKGICILSHTNVAREEIVRRLARTDKGSRLLTYPHFIGTIHGFVNQFLALPLLRSAGVSVDVIDDVAFAKRALARLQGNQYFKLRAWLNRQMNGDALVEQLFYKGPKLILTSEAGGLPGPTSDSGKQLEELKAHLMSRGVFRHRDMFAFALSALESHRHLLDVIHRRFPRVFVDEMQDTSWEQEDILNLLFDGKSLMQRFGDVDQKIIPNDDDARLTFPRVGHGSISTSKRFGPRIAAAVASVSIKNQAVVGVAPDHINPVLLLYKTADAGRVVRHFGKLVVDRFDEDALRDKTVRAMCARKAGDGGVEPGRHLIDYWPSYAQLAIAPAGVDGGFRSLVDRIALVRQPGSLGDHAADARKVVLLILQAAKAPVAAGVRDARALLRAVSETQGNALQLQVLIRDLVLEPTLLATQEARQALPNLLYNRLKALLPDDMSQADFLALDVFIQLAAPMHAPPPEPPTLCRLVHSGRELEFSLGTVASMKGETHLASLVLEAYGGTSRRLDLGLALPAIAGTAKGLHKLTDLQQWQLRNVYVAMSRPTHFLCLAANANRVDKETCEALMAKGWQVELLA